MGVGCPLAATLHGRQVSAGLSSPSWWTGGGQVPYPKWKFPLDTEAMWARHQDENLTLVPETASAIRMIQMAKDGHGSGRGDDDDGGSAGGSFFKTAGAVCCSRSAQPTRSYANVNARALRRLRTHASSQSHPCVHGDCTQCQSARSPSVVSTSAVPVSAH